MNGTHGSNPRSGQWLTHTVIGTAVGLIVAVLVVGLTVAIDQYAGPGIEIVDRQDPQPIVHISGEVATPGVYSLPPNGRLIDALRAAGGMTSDADRSDLNLAARLGDGERIEILTRSATPEPSLGGTPVTSDRINVNTATVEELDTLPEIGPVLAGRIVDDREENGPYLTVEGLIRVDGISNTTLEELRPLVTVDD